MKKIKEKNLKSSCGRQNSEMAPKIPTPWCTYFSHTLVYIARIIPCHDETCEYDGLVLPCLQVTLHGNGDWIAVVMLNYMTH